MMCGLKVKMIKKERKKFFPKGKKERKIFFKGKKATEINQQLVITILSIIFIIVLLIFAVRSCSLIKEKQRDIILMDLENGIRSLVELLSSKPGAVKQDTFGVPEDVDIVCFVDLDHSDIIMNSTQLTVEYPMINDSLNSNSSENVFLIGEKQVLHSFYGGDICFDYFPFYSCVIIHDNLLDVWFEGRSGCTTLYINWSIFPDNYKNKTKYEDSPLFLIKEEDDDINVQNWKEILSIVPLTLFREKDENQDLQTHIYNFSVAYKKNLELLDTSDVDNLMQEYSTEKTYLFNHQPIIPPPSGSINYLQIPIPPNQYINFWNDPSSVILVDSGNKHSALIASLLAAYVNTPLIFIDKDNLEYYDDEIIFGRRVFIVTHSEISLDDETYDYVRDYSLSHYELSDTLLGIEGSVEAFAKLYSDITID